MGHSENYVAQGHGTKSNLFNLLGARIAAANGGIEENKFIIGSDTLLIEGISAGGGKNTIIFDAAGATLRIRETATEKFAIDWTLDGTAYTRLSYNKSGADFAGGIQQLIVTDAAGADIQMAGAGMLFDISGVPGSILNIRGGQNPNVFFINEGNNITSSSDDAIFWDGKSSARLILQADPSKSYQQLIVNFSGTYDQVQAHRDGNNLVLGYQGKCITVQGVYLPGGKADASKLITVMDKTRNLFTLACLPVLGPTPMPLDHLPKSFVFQDTQDTEEAATPLVLKSDHAINTYSFAPNAGNFDLDFCTTSFNQLVITVSRDGGMQYTKLGDGLKLEFPGQRLTLNIRDYAELYNQQLLKIWTKPTGTDSADLVEMNLPAPAELKESVTEPYSKPAATRLPDISPMQVIDLNGLTEDGQVTAADLAAAGNELHISIPEWAYASRVIQCRCGNDLVLYFADHEAAQIGGVPAPLLFVSDAYLEATKIQVFLHQDYYQVDTSGYDQLEPNGVIEYATPVDLAPDSPYVTEIKAIIGAGEDADYYHVQTGGCYLQLTMLEGTGDIQVLKADGSPAQKSGDFNDCNLSSTQPELSMVSVYVTAAPFYVRIVRNDDSKARDFRYSLQFFRGPQPSVACVPSPDSFILMPEVSALPLERTTRLLGYQGGQVLDATAYAAVTGRGGGNTYRFDCSDYSDQACTEWTIDNTADHTDADRVELDGDFTFSQLQLLVTDADLGICVEMAQNTDGASSQQQKTVWLKDYVTNSFVRNLTVKLGGYGAWPEFEFALPVPDSLTGWLVLPSAPKVALIGPGKFLLDLDPYDQKGVTVFFSLSTANTLYIDQVDSDLPFYHHSEQIGYDLQINGTGQILYIRNYYRNARAIKFVALDDATGKVKAFTPFLIHSGVVLPDSVLNISQDVRETIWGESTYDADPSVPLIVEGLNNLDGRSLMTFMEKRIWSLPSQYLTTFGNLTGYCRMYGLPDDFARQLVAEAIHEPGTLDNAADIDTEVSSLIGSLKVASQVTIDPAKRDWVLRGILLHRASKGTLKFKDVSVFLSRYWSEIVNGHYKDWLKTEEDAGYAVGLLHAAANPMAIVYGPLLNLNAAQVATYSQTLPGSFILDDFFIYATFVSGVSTISHTDGSPAKTLNSFNNISLETEDKERRLLRSALYGKGYLRDKTETFIARMASMSYIPTGPALRNLDEMLDIGIWNDIKLQYFLKEGITAQDISLANENRTLYEKGKRDQLITVTVPPGFGNQRKAVYTITQAVSLSDKFILGAGGNDLQPGDITAQGGLSPAPDGFSDTTTLLRLIYENNNNSGLLKTTIVEIGQSWDGRSTPDNLVDGLDQPGEAYAWRAAIHVDNKNNPVDIAFESPYPLIIMQFKHKIQITAVILSIGYEVNVKDKPSGNRAGTYRIEAFSNATQSWLPVSPDPFTLPANGGIVNVPVDAGHIPYDKYRIVGISGYYDRDSWIQEITFTTAAVSIK